MTTFTLRWAISETDEGKIIREFLGEKQISRTALTDIKFQGGGIFVNGVAVTVRYQLKRDDQLIVQFPPEQRSEKMKTESIPLHIVYEDDYVLVLNKPPHLSTIPSREHPTGSLANGILGYYNEIDLQSTTHIVTRLDRDTSGLLLVAKHRHVHYLLSQGNIQRTYLGITHGVIQKHSDTINAPIGRKETSIIEREVRPDGQHAITHFKVVRRFKNMTLLSLTIETGRTHQIRVHLSHIGFPLVGDTLYGGKELGIDRQALHSSALTFWHPFLNKDLSFTADLPDDMKQII